MMWSVLEGDCRTVLAGLEAGSVQTCVTSPPYFGLRSYGGGEQEIGLEPTPDEFVAALVGVFREIRRVLRDDGTVWLNLGDSYAATSTYNAPRSMHSANGWKQAGRGPNPPAGEAKPKDLLGVPWMVAFALRADGWYLRSEIIWHKPNPMPESVTDRPTKSHEQVFLLSKGPRYFYDADAIREPHEDKQGLERFAASGGSTNGYEPDHQGWVDGGGFTMKPGAREYNPSGRNKRSVWTVATQPYPGAHFATFPAKLIEPCILAGCPERACGVCGAPWQRVVERTPAVVRPSERRERMQAEQGDRARTNLAGTMTQAPESRTVGWEPSCAHQDDTGQSVVLDPFAGAGTTGMVALRHNRSFIGIELSPVYAELARRRIVDDAPLLNSVLERSADPGGTITQ